MAGELTSEDSHREAGIRETRQEIQLIYLGHIWAAGQKATGYVVQIYQLAKENSGPLKYGIHKIESNVKVAASPVYEKFEGMPLQVLEFLDKKVSDSIDLLDSSVPQSVKEKAHWAYDFIQQTLGAIESVPANVRKNGLYQTVRTYSVMYESIADEWTREALKTVQSVKLDVTSWILKDFPRIVFGRSWVAFSSFLRL